MNVVYYSTRQPVALLSKLLYYIPKPYHFAKHLKDSYSGKLKKSLLYSSHYFGCLNLCSHLFLLAVNKVATFSKGFLIKQRAVFAGPGGICQTHLCTDASTGKIYRVCFGTVQQTCFFCISEQICTFIPSKENHHHRRKRRHALWQELTSVSRKDFSRLGST